jgi:hypothetical protein
VVGEVIAKADAPNPGAIQWLLLRAKSHEGSGMLSAGGFCPPGRHQRRGSAQDRLRPEPCLATGAHALLRDL